MSLSDQTWLLFLAKHARLSHVLRSLTLLVAVLCGITAAPRAIAQRALPQAPILPHANPLCDSSLVGCVDIDQFAGHAYAHVVVAPATDARTAAVSFPYGVSLGVFGRFFGAVSTDFSFWKEGDEQRRQHGPLRLSLTALLWPIVPLSQAPQQSQDAGGGSHFDFHRALRIGLDYQHELRIGPFDGANTLGYLGDLATLKMIVTKGIGPIELNVNGGALFDWKGQLATGVIAGQVGVHLPFFRAMKAYAEVQTRGFGSRGPIQQSTLVGGGFAFRLSERVDVGVSVHRGFGEVAPWTATVRFLVLSAGETYEQRAATPLVELGAEVAIEIKNAVQRVLARLPIDPWLDAMCVIHDDDGATLGTYGQPIDDARYCQKDGFYVPVKHYFYRPANSKDLLCRDRALTDCVLTRQHGEWVGIHQPMLNSQCRMIDTDGTVLGVLGEPTADGQRCRYQGERSVGSHGTTRAWTEVPMGHRLYADAGRTRVCRDPHLMQCLMVTSQPGEAMGWTPQNHRAVGFVRRMEGAGQAVKDTVHEVKQTAQDLADGKLTVQSVADSLEDKARKTCRWAAEGAKKVVETVSDLQRLEDCVQALAHGVKQEVDDYRHKPPGERAETQGRWLAGATIEGVSSLAGGRVLGVAERLGKGGKAAAKVTDAVHDAKKAKTASKGARAAGHGVEEVAEHVVPAHVPLVENPHLPGRHGAFRKAKKDAGIPKHQHPDKVVKTDMTDRDGNRIFDEKNEIITTREYEYNQPNGTTVVIQEHSTGHIYQQNGIGDQGPHFNLRPSDKRRTGKISGTESHYPFNPGRKQ